MASVIEPIEVLQTVPFFSDVLTADEMEMLADHARFVEFAVGATPIEEDGPGHAMYVISAGDALVTVHGEDEPVARLGRGDIVGEMSLLTGARRSATITAATPLEMIEISKEALAHVLAGAPDLVSRFAQMIHRRHMELDKLAGGGAWGMLRPGKVELALAIGDFYKKNL